MKHTSPRLYLHPLALVLTGVLFLAVILAGMRMQRMKKGVPEKTVLPAPQTPSGETTPPPPGTPVPRLPPETAPLPSGQDLILSEKERSVPGEAPSDWLYFSTVAAEGVKVSGAWDGWAAKSSMRELKPGLYAFHIGGVEAPFGSYEFKFIVDGVWEGGANRVLYLNEDGEMEKPPQVVSRALIEHPNQIRVLLYGLPENPDAVTAEFEPGLGHVKLRWRMPESDAERSGFRIDGKDVEFVFDPETYAKNPSELHSVQVAGNFNGWSPHALQRQAGGEWTVRMKYSHIDSKTTDPDILFKFVANGEWLTPPDSAPNRMLEPGTPHLNLQLPREHTVRPELRIITEDPMDLSRPPLLILNGLHADPIKVVPSPGAVLDGLYSPKPLGVTLDKENSKTVFRLFAPRAAEVRLGFFDGPYYVTEAGEPVAPARVLDMLRDENGVWEHSESGLLTGSYYAFQVDGPVGNGEGFNSRAWFGDPYAKAVALAEGNSQVMDLDAIAPRPRPEPRVAWEDMVIYETHVRHFTQHESSGVPENLRGKYKGFLASEGTGTGLDHLKSLGVNVIQLMPIHEFNNGFGDRHDWGYASCFFFAPESSYATRPLEGSQVQEFRELVDGLHQRGFAVFLDVVYNHIGGINVFNNIDRKYYFRLNPDFTNVDFSGCGNDVASERLMMRRLIRESVLFWVEEYGIDGFRFDLGELIDDKTLLEIEREIREKHPHVVLHSEPWSFRGSHKDFLGPTTWGAWNDRFREPSKSFVSGRGEKDRLKQAIRGSVENWTRHPLQSVNYMESHDDHALVDELSLDENRDGRHLSERDEQIHKLAATLIFSSLGTPMITEGQAYLRSKHGIRNTYNQGDALNSLRWEERTREHASAVLSYYRDMIAFRLSDAGRALRVRNAPSLDYTRFIENDRHDFLGWMLNANQERPGIPMVMVLMNAGETPVSLSVDLPGGVWRQVGDGQQVRAAGLPDGKVLQGGTSTAFEVPARTALIYRSGI